MTYRTLYIPRVSWWRKRQGRTRKICTGHTLPRPARLVPDWTVDRTMIESWARMRTLFEQRGRL